MLSDAIFDNALLSVSIKTCCVFGYCQIVLPTHDSTDSAPAKTLILSLIL